MAHFRTDRWPCPFCGEETIKVVVRPSMVMVKRTGKRSGKKTTLIKTKGETIILSENCSNCGKDIKAIKKFWKERGFV